jgi:hypothetical protein
MRRKVTVETFIMEVTSSGERRLNLDCNARYQPETARIDICWTLSELLEEGAGFSGFAGAFAFTILHELAHAIVIQHQVPIVGDEEASVDQLAALLLLESDPETSVGNSGVLVKWIDFLRWLGSGESADAMRTHHGSSVQRAERLECILLGWDSGQPELTLARIFREQFWNISFSSSRREECKAQYNEVRENWKRLLSGIWSPSAIRR